MPNKPGDRLREVGRRRRVAATSSSLFLKGVPNVVQIHERACDSHVAGGLSMRGRGAPGIARAGIRRWRADVRGPHTTPAMGPARCPRGGRVRDDGDRKSTRLTPVTNAHLVCRLLLDKKTHTYQPP